jgi:hypothetical protein
MKPAQYNSSESNLPIGIPREMPILNFRLSVDCGVFGYEQGKIKVLLVKRNIKPYKGK